MMRPGDWLDGRLAEAPDSLRTSVHRAVIGWEGAEAGQFSDVLMAAADGLLAIRPSTPGPQHEEALNLLTADALITLACEWVAEQDPESLGELR